MTSVASVADRETARDNLPVVPPFAAHNFRALVGDVSCFFIGMSFLDTATALPAVVRLLGGDAAFLGLLLAIRQGGYFLPQLFVAHHLQNADRYKPFIVRVCFLGRIWLFGAALVVYFFGATRPALALAALGIAFTTSWVGDGSGSVPWTAFIGRAIPSARRGRLFATTQVVGGISRFFVSAVVGALLGGRIAPFPTNAALLVLGCAVFLGLSWVFLALLREPPSNSATRPVVPVAGFGDYARGLPARFRARPDFARLALVQILASTAGACAPFYVGYVQSIPSAALPQTGLLAAIASPFVSHAPTSGGALVGLFLAVQTAGLLLLAPVWGMITDRNGPRRALLCILPVALLSPVAVLCGGQFGGGLPLFLVAYLLFGGVQDGWVAITNYLLEAVPEDEQPTYIGLMNAASAPALFLPFLLGLLVRNVSAPAALLVAVLLLAIGLYAAWGLPDTRAEEQKENNAAR